VENFDMGLGIGGLRNWGIERLKDNINKLKQIEFLNS
jgi:hypothetical protein